MTGAGRAEAVGAWRRLPGGVVAVAGWRGYVRALVGAALWLLPPLWVGRALGRLGRRRALHALERRWARRVLSHLGVALDARGLELVDPAERYVVVSLHEGLVDPLALLHLPLDLRFAARDEIFGWRLVGPYLRDTEQIAVSPEEGARAYRRLRRGAAAAFAAGESVVVFAQGTILGIETDLTRGAFALARSCGRPILPVAVTGTHRVWEHPFSLRLRYGQPVSLRVLPSIPAARCRVADPEALRREVQAQLKRAALADGMAPPRRYVPAHDGWWDGYAFRIDPAFAELHAEAAARHARGTGRAGMAPT